MRAHLGTNSIALFKCLRAASLIIFIHSVYANHFASLLPRERELLERTRQDGAAVPGIGFARNNIHDDLVGRQAECEGESDQFQCPNDLNYCCPGNFTCIGQNICCPGTASGLQLCPNNSFDCYVPASQICCSAQEGGGTCPVKTTCCGAFCCFAWEYCGSDGSCTDCPDATVTQTTTTSGVWVSVVTITATQLSEPAEANGQFSCPPVTATNSQGATLELDAACVLSYIPPPGNTSAAMTTTSIAAPVAVARDEMLLGRQTAPSSCSPFMTWTDIVTISSLSTTTETETTTTTTTVEGFSCPTMAITNTYGNVLSLISSCSLEFFLSAPASTSTSVSGGAGATNAGGSGGSGGGNKSAATSSYAYRLSAWWTWTGVVFLVLLLL